jgi:hypothetical protein
MVLLNSFGPYIRATVFRHQPCPILRLRYHGSGKLYLVLKASRPSSEFLAYSSKHDKIHLGTAVSGLEHLFYDSDKLIVSKPDVVENLGNSRRRVDPRSICFRYYDVEPGSQSRYQSQTRQYARSVKPTHLFKRFFGLMFLTWPHSVQRRSLSQVASKFPKIKCGIHAQYGAFCYT